MDGEWCDACEDLSAYCYHGKFENGNYEEGWEDFDYLGSCIDNEELNEKDILKKINNKNKNKNYENKQN